MSAETEMLVKIGRYVSPCFAYRDYSVATKRKLVEILKFRHFAPHVVFDAEGDKYRNKRTRNYITVSVVINLECGNTNRLSD